MTIIGIDLGTTNSLVSIWNSKKSQIIPNAMNECMTPSVVSVDDTGDILIGQAARERLITHPDKTAALFKRHMGSGKKYTLSNQVFKPEELSALILKALKDDAEVFLKEKITEAVISVPAYFNDTQRKATRIAGELAGLNVERLINEPTAAAMAYGLHHKTEDATILIFDLGGGTFDVSILEFFNGIMEVRATAGDSFLGGQDFIEMITRHFCRQNDVSLENLSPSDSGRIYKMAETVLHRLSTEKQAEVDITVQKSTFQWRLGRKEFEAMTPPLLRRLRLPVERALMDASIKPNELADIVLVGGATRIPLIRSLVARMFGRFPSFDVNPDEAVALGTAIQAGFKSRDKALREVVFTDVCPYSLGIEVVIHHEKIGYATGQFAPIMERGVVVPASKEERFYTIHNGQEKIEVLIFQGESRLVKDNIQLGKITVPVPPAPAGQEAIDIRFTYNIDGILEVEVRVVSSGVKKKLVIEETPGGLTQEEIDQRLAALSELKIHPRDQIENRTLLAKGERLFETRLKKDRSIIAEAMVQLEAAIESQDQRRIVKKRRELAEILQRIDNDGVAL